MSDWEEIEFDEQCKEANDNYIQDLKVKYKQKIKILEKALDKACELLGKNDHRQSHVPIETIIKLELLEKAQKELENRKNLGNSIFVDYIVSEDCQNEDSDSVCLKCGKCGRMFDENGILIERK